MRRLTAGFTLIELIVVLALLGVMAGLTGLALGADRQPDPDRERLALVADARREALMQRHRVLFSVPLPGGHHAEALALPDGRVLADAGLDIDPLNGRPDATP